MTILSLHDEPLQDVWLDAYGHLNEASYLICFTNAAWPFQDHFGIGLEYFDHTGCAIYTLETHLRYVDEVRAPAHLDVKSMVFGSDAKRIHCGHIMEVDGRERATVEFMFLHYDTREGRPSSMPDEVQAALKAAQMAEIPDWVGRNIGLDKKK
jgi:acyl-CoA thioester hydrolase